MTQTELKEFLDEKARFYNNPSFIESDPIQIPHQFSKKEDIEIAAFLTATISWGNRKMIIQNASKMMELLEFSPHDFILNHHENDLKSFDKFVHRTFNSVDFQQFIKSLQHIYLNHGGLENTLLISDKSDTYQKAIHQFKKLFFEIPHSIRTQKHISDPLNNSAAKRINMYLRWMVRKDKAGVDFGIWERISPGQLICPLDVHVARVARRFNLLQRTPTDWQAALELTSYLRRLDPQDPVKYDFALFGLGVIEKF